MAVRGFYSENDTLVTVICQKFASGAFTGKYGPGENDICMCDETKGLIDKNTGAQVNACLISGNEKNNWLQYHHPSSEDKGSV